MLQGFVTAGLRVPDDMAIVGYDDIAFAAAAAVPLSSVRQPRLAIGYRAAELLFDEVEANESDAAHEHQQVRFTPELVVRRSSAMSRDLPAVCRHLGHQAGFDSWHRSQGANRLCVVRDLCCVIVLLTAYPAPVRLYTWPGNRSVPDVGS